MTEFLSLCDVLFNVVSLAGYFCDVVFDVVLSYALFERGHYMYMAVVISLVIVSLIISQVIKSVVAFYRVFAANKRGKKTLITLLCVSFSDIVIAMVHAQNRNERP